MRYENILIHDNITVLQQGLNLLYNIDDRLYTHTGQLPHTASVGGHMRHCLDFYHCFVRGSETGIIDYDRRERDDRIARERHVAVATIETLVACLEQQAHMSGQQPVQVRLDQSPQRSDADAWSASSVARELQFLVSHTIHHYALIATLLRLQGFEPGKEFGVAPATLAYWRTLDMAS